MPTGTYVLFNSGDRFGGSLEPLPHGNAWQPTLDTFFNSKPAQQIQARLAERIAAGATIYPPDPLRALRLTPLGEVKVVILGQDPYHGLGQAEGLAFSVPIGIKPPPSLRNIHKELLRDGQINAMPQHGSLAAWAQRGVLLLNATLTVEDGQPASHAKRGWEALTDTLIEQVALTQPHVVYLLWGAHAQAKQALIGRSAQAAGNQALTLCANHPSPLSALRPPAPFIGCGHFGQARHWLAERGIALDWSL